MRPQMTEENHPEGQRRFFLFYIVLAFVGGIIVLMLLPAINVVDDEHRRATSANNLRQLRLVCKMYANDHDGKWPPLSSVPGQLTMHVEEVYPEYLSDPEVLVSPAHPDAAALLDASNVEPPEVPIFTDDSYWYLGYRIENEEEGLAFVEAYRKIVESGDGFAWTRPIETSVGSILLLDEGETRFQIIESNSVPSGGSLSRSRIPILVERPGMHESGANVLFADGHAEFVEYPGEFPMTEKFIRALERLDELKETN